MIRTQQNSEEKAHLELETMEQFIKDRSVFTVSVPSAMKLKQIAERCYGTYRSAQTMFRNRNPSSLTNRKQKKLHSLQSSLQHTIDEYVSASTAIESALAHARQYTESIIQQNATLFYYRDLLNESLERYQILSSEQENPPHKYQYRKELLTRRITSIEEIQPQVAITIHYLDALALHYSTSTTKLQLNDTYIRETRDLIDRMRLDSP